MEKELAQIREQANALKVRWKEEKEGITRIRQLKERIEQLKIEEQQAERSGNLERVAAIRYGELRQAETELAKLSAQADDKQRRMLKEEVDEEDVARNRFQMDRHSGIEDAGRRGAQAGEHGGSAAPACGGAG